MLLINVFLVYTTGKNSSMHQISQASSSFIKRTVHSEDAKSRPAQRRAAALKNNETWKFISLKLKVPKYSRLNGDVIGIPRGGPH